MAAESFAEALQRLKEIHDKEVLGMQAKLSDLTMEKCRDAQRIEELFSKNHLLREQHKVLNENIKVLENRLRAGLCDRCTVTQELAKKKQQEFESSHLHSLQQISGLTNEMKSLKEENRSLLEELKKQQCLDNKHHQAFSPEIKAGPDSPRTLSASISQRNGVEKSSREEESPERASDPQVSEEKYPVAAKLSPGGKTPHILGPETHIQENHIPMAQKIYLSSLNQQKISNQLHGTIAVLRPGFRSGRAGIPSSLNKRASSNEMFPKASGVDPNDASSQLDSLKHIPEEQMCFLRQHLAQRRLGPQAPVAMGDGRCILTKGQDTEATRKVPQDDWDERVAMAELHGAMMFLRDRGFRGRVLHPDQRDRLNYILTRQHQGQRSPKSPGDVPASQRRDSIDEGELSLLHMLSARWKNKQHESQTEEKEPDMKEPKYEVPEKRQQDEPTPDKPLDLSDARRGQPSYWPGSQREQRGPHEGYSTSPTFTNNFSPQAANTDVRGSEESRLLGSLVKEENACNEEEVTKDMKRNSSPSADKERDGISGKRSTRGHKRERSLETGEPLFIPQRRAPQFAATEELL
ncbi:hypothetical protein XENTR_v10003499 [Xenopus tropicalis]|nr:hypothetical protein XENTR_v10003499 [Xenopus tropicalis]